MTSDFARPADQAEPKMAAAATIAADIASADHRRYCMCFSGDLYEQPEK
jgi:hypothetical protein